MLAKELKRFLAQGTPGSDPRGGTLD